MSYRTSSPLQKRAVCICKAVRNCLFSSLSGGFVKSDVCPYGQVMLFASFTVMYCADAQSDVMCSLLTREAHITRRSRHHARSAHHVPRAEHIVPKTKKAVQWTAFVFGCGGRICTIRPSGYEPDELPSCSTPRYMMVPETGIEPVRD